MTASEKKMVKVTIDDQQVEVEEGLPLIQAAERVGKDIPRFCYHPDLSIAGNCRMCVVEVEGARGLPISCATPCADGMVARTDTQKVKDHRASVMEFLLVNHPIDCPICDQAGECSLQVYYMEHDQKDSRLEVDKVEYGKRIEVGPRVVLDQERCVECTRCIRFCDEVPQTGELRMMNRGDREVIDTFPGVPLENPYSVNTADICPVGALTERDFRFKVRSWFLQEAPSICPGCSRGCNVDVHYGWHPTVRDYDGKAYRVRPRRNDDVNKSWMCDFGRGEYNRVNENRITEAMRGGKVIELDAALRDAQSELEGAGSGALVAVSLECTLEEMLLSKLISERIGCEIVAVPDHADGFEDDILITRDKHPNRKGAEWLGLEIVAPTDLAKRLDGRTAVFMNRVNILALDENDKLASLLNGVPVRIALAAQSHSGNENATTVIPGVSFIEKTGHWVNVEGRVQRLKPGRHMKSPKGAQEDLKSLAAILGREDLCSARSVFDLMVAEIPALGSLTWSGVVDLGTVPEPNAVEAHG